jgi:itaconate CoA-transferase
MTHALYYACDGAPAAQRTAAAHATIFPYGPFPTGDGKRVMLGLQNEREWVVFCERVLQRSELATDSRFSSNARRVAAREELRGIIVAVFANLTADELVARLESAQIANARLNDLQDVWNHPQLAARERWTEVGSPVGAVPALLPPALPAQWTPRMDPVPALGEHTDAILSELGYDELGIRRLRAANAI